MALNFKTLLTRTLTAAVFVAVLLFCINYNYLSFSILFLVVSVWGLIEFYQIAEKLGAAPFYGIGIVTAIVLYVSGICLTDSCIIFPLKSLVPVLLFCILIAALFSKQDRPIHNVAYTIAGIIYAVMPFVMLNKIASVRN